MADGASEADAQLGTGGYELALHGGGGGEAGRRVLGNRNFALFYRCACTATVTSLYSQSLACCSLAPPSPRTCCHFLRTGGPQHA